MWHSDVYSTIISVHIVNRQTSRTMYYKTWETLACRQCHLVQLWCSDLTQIMLLANSLYMEATLKCVCMAMSTIMRDPSYNPKLYHTEIIWSCFAAAIQCAQGISEFFPLPHSSKGGGGERNHFVSPYWTQVLS